MQPTNNIRPLRVWTAAVPKEGPAVVPYTLDFSATSSYLVDLTRQFDSGALSIVQAIYADNSNNNAELSVTCQDTQQTLIWPANSQGYLPCLQTVNFKFLALSTGLSLVKLHFLNFNVAPGIWSVNGTPLLTASGAMLVQDTILESAVTGGVMQTAVTGNLAYTNRSGTIAAGGTAQSLMGVNLARRAWQLENLSTGDLWYSFFGAATVGGANGSFKLVAGAYYESAPGLAPPSAISIIGATTSQAFTATEA